MNTNNSTFRGSGYFIFLFFKMDLIYIPRVQLGKKILIKIFVLFSIYQMNFCVDLIYTIKEGENPGTYVGDIATDSTIMKSVSLEEQTLIQFNQLQQSETKDSQLFQVSKKSGRLYTAQILDTEAMCTYKKECFQLLDVAIQKGTSTIKILEIKVKIQDVNDHQPEFPHKQVSIEFEEGHGKGMKTSIPNAIDKDIGIDNSKITYQLKKNQDEPFELMISKDIVGASKLALILTETLDREVKDVYNLKIVAKDGGLPPKESVLDVLISVTDVNDNAPVFAQNIYNISIKNKPSESSPIVIVKSTDLDIGINGRVSYHFSSQTSESIKNNFKINELTGEIFLYKTLGQEPVYNLYIEATDRGRPLLSSTAIVIVNVIDQQNNPPVIKVNFASHSKDNKVDILENVQVGSFIAYVKVSDQDAGQNGDVNCEIEHNKFQLQSMEIKKYQVIVKTLLDREKEEHHDVVISCHDKGSPPLHSNSKFCIQVMDINDVEPQFTKDTFKFLIDENENSRITVGYINATDPDLGAGGKLSYSLITNNKHFLPFKISTNGLLSAVMSLDHEFQDTYEFQVFVKDDGTPSLNNTVNVIVEVTDKNDNAPYFTFPSVKLYNLDVTYYPHHTKNITQIKASDSDSQENAFLKYEIIKGNDKQMFSMNQYTGLLGFNRHLSPENAGTYQLDIVVKDSGSPVLSATTTLFLTLTISNKTSQMLNVVELKSEKKIHFNLVIIITVIAVTIAVFITASLSICIIRCNGQSNVAYAQSLDPSNRYFSEQKHLIASTYPLTIDENLTRKCPLTGSKGQLIFGQKTLPKVLPQVNKFHFLITMLKFIYLCMYLSKGYGQSLKSHRSEFLYRY